MRKHKRASTGKIIVTAPNAVIIGGADKVTGPNATIIGEQIGLSPLFVRDLLAAKDRQIEELLQIIERLTR